MLSYPWGDTMPNELGQIIKEARKDAGMTQKSLASLLGVATGTVQQWELGLRMPRYETLEKLEDVFHIALVPSRFHISQHTDLALLDETKIRASAGISEADYLKETRLLSAFYELNEAGQQKAIERIEELAEIPKYQK